MPADQLRALHAARPHRDDFGNAYAYNFNNKEWKQMTFSSSQNQHDNQSGLSCQFRECKGFMRAYFDYIGVKVDLDADGRERRIQDAFTASV